MASDCFLKLDGIEGESQDHEHPKEIEILAWGFTASQTEIKDTSGSAGRKGQMSDLEFTINFNSAGTPLLSKLLTGFPIPRGVLVCRKASRGGGAMTFLTVTLTDVRVSSFKSELLERGTSVPHIVFQLRYSKIQIDYKPQTSDGGGGAANSLSWDLKASKPS